MLRLKNVHGYKVEASDGIAGIVYEILYDAKTLNTRYIVVNTETALNKNLVLLEPENISNIYPGTRIIETMLTINGVKNSLPLERIRDEYETADAYAWPYYWLGTAGGFPGVTPSRVFNLPKVIRTGKLNNRIVSSRELVEYKAKTSDGYHYNVKNLLLDESTFNIKYLDLSTLFSLSSAGRMLVSVNSILGFFLDNELIHLANTLAEVRNSNGYARKESYRFAFNFKSIF
jgi:hypothetical protein